MSQVNVTAQRAPSGQGTGFLIMFYFLPTMVVDDENGACGDSNQSHRHSQIWQPLQSSQCRSRFVAA